MKHPLLTAVCLLVALTAPSTGLAQATPEIYGALPNVDEAAISPDGKTIAQIQADGDLRVVAIYDLSGAAKPIGVKLGTVKARALGWADDDHVLLLVSTAKTVAWGAGLETHEFWQWYSIDRQDGSTAHFDPSRIYVATPPQPHTAIIQGFQSLYRVNLKDGDAKLYERGDSKTVEWVVDADGAALVRIDYDDIAAERRFLTRDGPEGRFRKRSALPEKREDDPAFVAWAATDTPNAIQGSARSSGFWSACTLDATVGLPNCKPAPTGYDVSGAIIDAKSARVVGIWHKDDFSRQTFTDPELSKVSQSLSKALPGGNAQITSYSRDRDKFMVRAEYADHPPQFYLFDRQQRKLGLWSASYKALDGKSVAAKSRFEFRSSDGFNIAGYLTTPNGAPPRNMPLIVLPHGGPEARDDMAFDWWPFFYAARGYLVYQPNFRGSSGYGVKFKEAGYLQWGRKMQDDITEGVKKLIADGVADPSRVCIVGASYGGYAALAGATLTPDLYKCVVSVAGVSNIPALIAYQTDRGEVPENAWDVRIGARVSDNAKLKEVSPAFIADRAGAPILLIHGKDDIVVPPGQSRFMRDALVKARKPVEYIELKGEDHWLSSAATRTEMLRASIQFIDKHIGSNAQ